jgi:hypothetical protein
MPPAAVNPGNARVNVEKNTALMVAARDGDLDRVQQILAAIPGHKKPRLDLANKYGWRAIHYAAKSGNVDILNALAAAGANINIKTLKGATPLGVAVFYNKLPILERLIELGADVNAGFLAFKPIRMALGIEKNENRNRLLIPIAIDLLRAGANLEILEVDLVNVSFKLLHAIEARIILGNPIDIDALTEEIYDLLFLLLQLKPAQLIPAWNAVQIIRQMPPIYISTLLAETGNVQIMRLALENGLILAHPGQPDNENPILLAQDGRFEPDMNDLIIEYQPPQLPAQPLGQMWKGWTRGDLGNFDTVFDAANAHRYSICPVCFKFVERQDGCMYMHHNCMQEKEARGGFVYTELYQKYKGADGEVWWCTVCGRICKGHIHYELLPPFIERPTTVRPDFDANLFGNDCLGANRGGGIPEKVARFRRVREHALELQGQIDLITEEQAMKELVEEMWKAPIARYERRAQQILQQGRFNIPTTNFPPNVVAAPEAIAPAPNVNRPQANRNDPALRPTVVEEPDMMNIMTMNDIPRGIKFHHRKPDGTLYHHEAPIGRPGFLAWFGNEGQGMARNFADPRFGRCFEVDCNAILYPQELEPFVDTAEEVRFIPRDLFEIYRANFNRHMPARLAAPAAAAQGGYRRIRKTRKGKGKRKQLGGQAHDMFLELEGAQCLLPRRGQQVTNSKGGRRKTRRRR